MLEAKSETVEIVNTPKITKTVRFNPDIEIFNVEVSQSSDINSDSGSPLIDLETILEDRHSDDLFNSDTDSDSNTENVQVLSGHKAKKMFQVKFSGMN